MRDKRKRIVLKLCYALEEFYNSEEIRLMTTAFPFFIREKVTNLHTILTHKVQDKTLWTGKN